MPPHIENLYNGHLLREGLLALNNASARETSRLTVERFDRMIAAARVATFVAPHAALMLAFEQGDAYDGVHFQWFQTRFDRFLYIDRIVVAEGARGLGLGRAMYEDIYERAQRLGHTRIACEVNVNPPNPASVRFHARQGFAGIATATVDHGAKTVSYLLKSLV